MFLGGAPNLRHLSLRTGSLNGGVQRFQQLVSLEIGEGRNTGSRYGLKALTRMFRSIARLQYLKLAVNVAIEPGTDLDNETLPLLALEHLDVEFGSTGAGVLVSLFQMPNLAHTTLTIDTVALMGFAACLSRRQNTFSAVSTLSLRVPDDGPGPPDIVRALFGPFLSVTRLDLANAPPLIFYKLVDATIEEEAADFPRGILLPGLKHLVLNIDALSAMRRFVDVRMTVARTPYSRIPRIGITSFETSLHSRYFSHRRRARWLASPCPNRITLRGNLGLRERGGGVTSTTSEPEKEGKNNPGWTYGDSRVMPTYYSGHYLITMTVGRIRYQTLKSEYIRPCANPE
ncbi:hypothetical protein B0H17DRAFT_1137839 [Mycena rosella]|uniref:Uncharacterized protein n=1 Tax=Mycena rosella TaxID=1033263 RepID=A0AAD7GD04_MYCRO|nr:hypothetical protein B0H17DRAFT_1137839 [Mycena rosella]